MLCVNRPYVGPRVGLKVPTRRERPLASAGNRTTVPDCPGRTVDVTCIITEVH